MIACGFDKKRPFAHKGGGDSLREKRGSEKPAGFSEPLFSRRESPPPLCAKGLFLSNPHAIIDERCYFLYTKLIGAGTIFLLCQWLLKRNKE